MQTSYLFYDLETSGLSKAFDQVQQFAAKKLDLDLNAKTEHYFEAKLTADIIPSAYAMITHRVSLAQDHTRLNEYQVVCKIHELMNQPGTISLGYNTLGFDDGFLRFSFHRNLLAPYTHQYQGGCMRMDIFPMAVFYYLFAADSMVWPEVDGRPTLKLEALAEVNQWAAGRAHHAMNDVDATIALARNMQHKNTQMWRYLTGFFHKATDQQRINALEEIVVHEEGVKCGLFIDAKLGANQRYNAPCLALGVSKKYKNASFWLRLDKPLPEEISAQALFKGHVIQKKYAEPGFILPLNERFSSKMSLEAKQTMQENIKTIQANKEIWYALKQVVQEGVLPNVGQIDPDAQLYSMGFRSDIERDWCCHWHALNDAEQIQAIKQLPEGLLKTQATRLVWRKNSDIDNDLYQQDKLAALQQLVGDSGPSDYRGEQKYTAVQAQKDIKELREKSLDEEQLALLSELEQLIQKKNQEAGVCSTDSIS